MPSSINSIVSNITITDTFNSSYLTVYPYATNMPIISNLNWTGVNQTVVNQVTSKLGQDSGGNMGISTYDPICKPSNGTPEVTPNADLVVDVEGWYN